MKSTGPGFDTDQDGDQAFPVREYIGAMALEMARMAEGEGDDRLRRLLQEAAAVASRPAEAAG